MSTPAESPAPVHDGFLSPDPERQPTDHCFRCGTETPAGVGLCEEHNPKRLAGPSSTQMHATVFIGIALGVIGLFVLFGLTATQSGPFSTQVTSASFGDAGRLAVAFRVTNDGATAGHADCKLTRDGVPRSDDVAFRTPKVPARGTLSLSQSVDPAADDDVDYVAELVTIVCS